MLRNILLILVLGLIIGCSTEQQAIDSSQSDTVEPQAVTSSQSTPTEAAEELSFNLVFFLDPNGGPCIKQNSILENMSGELNGKVNLRYVSTTVEDHRQLFYHYGVRALPTLLLADSSGKEIKRMTPGIKNVADIRSFLQSIDKG